MNAEWVLRTARGLIAGGTFVSPSENPPPWADGLSKSGRWCFYDDPEISCFTTAGAMVATKAMIHKAGMPTESVQVAWRLLRRTFDPIGTEIEEIHFGSLAVKLWARLKSLTQAQPEAKPSIEDWLEAPERTLSEVLRAFDKAILRAKGERTDGRS